MKRTLLQTLTIIVATLVFAAMSAAAPQTKETDRNIRVSNGTADSTGIQSIDRSIYNSAHIQADYTFEIQQENTDALTATPSVFRAKKMLSTSIANFGTLSRRAPLRRKGRIQG